MKELKSKEELNPNMPLYDFIGKTIETLEWSHTGVDIKFTDGTYGYLSISLSSDVNVNFKTNPYPGMEIVPEPVLYNLCKAEQLEIYGGLIPAHVL